jgi:hypothetical protein
MSTTSGPRESAKSLPYEDSRIVRCPAISWNQDLSVCRACNKPLTGRQQRWCSPGCRDWYGRNHFWTLAREARLEIDGYRCTRCGDGPGYARPRFYMRATFEKVWKLATPLEVNHVWPLAHQRRPRKRYDYKLREHVVEQVPIKHADSGCHHHVSLLVTLCKPCHRRTTNQQFGFKKVSPQLVMEVA